MELVSCNIIVYQFKISTSISEVFIP